MTRSLYGFRPSDYTTDALGAPIGGVGLTVWDQRTGGNAVTDLLTTTGTAITTLTSATDGRVAFQGPDGYSGPLWIQASTGARYLMDSTDIITTPNALTLADTRAAAAVTAHVQAVDPHGTQAYTDAQLQNYLPFTQMANVASTGSILDVAGAELVFFYNLSNSRYELNGLPNSSAAALTSAHPKLFFGPAANHPKNITTTTGPAGTAVAVTPVFHKYDRFKRVG